MPNSAKLLEEAKTKVDSGRTCRIQTSNEEKKIMQ